ncbi:MAG TPA: GTPase HflX [Candidatus Dormibacteraeota bacterium]|nr:GTPase HflX [Candidatus Dormibacteraeota bacterium]
MKTTQSTHIRETVFLAGFGLRRHVHVPGIEAETEARESMEELTELARSAGAEQVGRMIQIRDAPDPATLFGKGKLEEIKQEAEAHHATLLIVDASLNPGQQRNIEKAVGLRTIDRVQLILDIFARHARSREGQLQVELAQLNYMLPRLAGSSASLSRLGGGIGTRGPGEQKLETDRRRIRRRIAHLEGSLETVRRERALRRRARQDVPLATIALVGYTNAGKSTLFNALTRANVTASPRMFATLDPTVRSLTLPSKRRVLVSDTVGFIRDLPPGLMTSFRATLEELQQAALILHVIDISSPRQAEQEVQVDKVLTDLDLEARPRLRVFNKIDRLDQTQAPSPAAVAGGISVSALTGTGLGDLIEAIDRALPVDPIVKLHLRVPVRDGRRVAAIRASGRVLESQVHDSELWMDVELPESAARRLQGHGSEEPEPNAKS